MKIKKMLIMKKIDNNIKITILLKNKMNAINFIYKNNEYEYITEENEMIEEEYSMIKAKKTKEKLVMNIKQSLSKNIEDYFKYITDLSGDEVILKNKITYNKRRNKEIDFIYYLSNKEQIKIKDERVYLFLKKYGSHIYLKFEEEKINKKMYESLLSKIYKSKTIRFKKLLNVL